MAGQAQGQGRFTAGFPEEEYAAVQGLAKSLNMTVSEVLRAAAQRMIREWAKEVAMLEQQAGRR